MGRLFTAVVAAGLLLPGAVAQADSTRIEPVLVLRDGKVHVTRERFLGPTALAGTRARARGRERRCSQEEGVARSRDASRTR